MKKKFQNGINLFITLILLFSLAPLGVMAEDRTTDDENATPDSVTTIQDGSLLSQSDNIPSVDIAVDQTVSANTDDIAIEVTLSATDSLKSDVGKKMILMGVSDYQQIKSLKINAASGIKLGYSDIHFITNSLKNIRKLDFSGIKEVKFYESLNNCEYLEDVVFQDGAVLAHSMFQDCISLKSVDLSNVDPNFGNSLFFNCTSLENVILPYGAKINEDTFGNCTSLKTIDLSNSNSLIGNAAFENCTNLEKVTLPQNTTLSGDTFKNCIHLDELNFDAITSFKGQGYRNSSIVRNCAFDFTQGYPVSEWTDDIVSERNNGQIPKVYFSLEKTTYQVNIGDSFTIPTPLFKTKSGTNYSDLEKYKSIYGSWLDQNTSYLNKMTYKTTIKFGGQIVDNIDTSIPGTYEITYDLLSTTYADCHSLTCNVIVSPGYSISSFSADKASGQVVNSTINLSASATAGEQPYQYKFYYQYKNSTVVLKDFSADNTAVFKPTNAGSYTLFVEAKDSSGKISTKSISNYVIENDAIENISCSYRTHVQNIGWQEWRSNGTMSGTSGQSLRLEGIEINLDNQGNDLGVEYSTHIQNIGWQDFKTNGEMSGTSGQSLRLEAIKINLKGNDAGLFDVYYRVHAQNVGWLDWASNGAESGTSGFGYRLEGIEIKIVTKGDPAPGATTKPFIKKSSDFSSVVTNPDDTSQIDFAEKVTGLWSSTPSGAGANQFYFGKDGYFFFRSVIVSRKDSNWYVSNAESSSVGEIISGWGNLKIDLGVIGDNMISINGITYYYSGSSPNN